MARVSARELEVLLRTFNTEHPGVVLGNGFLQKAAIVDGLRASTTSEELGGFFEDFDDVRAVVADEEGYRGERVGLVVFPDSGNCSAASNQASENYESVIRVDSIGIDREFLIKAVRGPTRTKDVIRSGNVRNLMGVLFAVNPEVADDPQFKFLERSVLLIGVSSETTPRDLTMRCFGGRDIDAAVIVRDTQTSERLGLVVFANATDANAAVEKNRQPIPWLYRRCFPADSVRHAQQAVLEGSEDCERRKETTATMRSLIPQKYLQSGDPTDFHLRCVLMRSSRMLDLSQGLHNLCRVAEENLLATGRLCAAVVSEALNAAVLVYDDSQSTDRVSHNSSRLPAGSLRLYDSSLFPMPAGDVATDQVPEERIMLPELFTKPEYLGRVVSLRGVDANKCDARELAYYLTGFKLEALYIHRADRRVFAVFGSQSDIHLARLRGPRSWGKLCDRRLWFEDLDEEFFQTTVPAPAPEQGVAAPAQHYAEKATEMAKQVTELSIAHCSSGDIKGIAEGLVRLAATSKPVVLLHKDFLHRAVLLMGIDAGTTEPDLCSELGNAFGEVDALALAKNDEKGVALAVFKSWTAAARLRQLPAKTLKKRFGIDHCELMPEEVDVATLVSGASDMARIFRETYGRVVSYVDSLPSSSGTSSGG